MLEMDVILDGGTKFETVHTWQHYVGYDMGYLVAAETAEFRVSVSSCIMEDVIVACQQEQTVVRAYPGEACLLDENGIDPGRETGTRRQLDEGIILGEGPCRRHQQDQKHQD